MFLEKIKSSDLKLKSLWTEWKPQWSMESRISSLLLFNTAAASTITTRTKYKYKYNYSIPPPQIQVQTEPEVQSHVDAQVEYHLDPEVDGRDTSTQVKYNVLPQVQ